MLGIRTIQRRIRSSRVPKNALEGAVALAREVSQNEVDEMRRRLQEVLDIQRATPSVLPTFLPIEALAQKSLEERVVLLKNEREMLTRAIPLALKYKRLSLEPLSWRDKNGFPCLVVFALNSSDFIFEGRTYNEKGESWVEGRIQKPKLPDALERCFNDVMALMLKKAQRASWSPHWRGSITFTCHFTGIIPDQTKAKITSARSDFGDNIFIIGEVRGWKQDVYTDPDPLVVGWDGKDLWLIDVFDVTPIEQAAALYPTEPTNYQA